MKLPSRPVLTLIAATFGTIGSVWSVHYVQDRDKKVRQACRATRPSPFPLPYRGHPFCPSHHTPRAHTCRTHRAPYGWGGVGNGVNGAASGHTPVHNSDHQAALACASHT